MVNRLILLASLTLSTAAALASRPAAPAPAAAASALPARQEDISDQYAGSDACARCHDVEHAQWKRSLHVRMTKPVEEASISGDFDRVSFSDHGRTYRMSLQDGRPVVAISHRGGPFEQFDVHYTLGAKRFQGYLSRLADGRIYVLPIFWHVEQRRWVDWKDITPIPDGAHDLRQIWNVTCFNCHATNLAAGFDLDSKSYRTTWTEMGIGCESCHGPGKPHIELMEEWERTPAAKPAYDRRAANRALSSVLRIFSGRTAAPRQVYDTCAYCHGNKNNEFLGFVPGARLEDFALPFLVSQAMPEDDPQGDFWPDGRPSRFNRPQALTLSGCFIKGGITCTNCHVAHGSRNEHSLKVPISASDGLCTQCHGSLSDASALEPHTRHPASSAGSRCIACHMSDVNWRLLIRRRDHTFAPPVPEMTAKYGVPNACTACHDDRSPEWAAGVMDRWYGDGERRARAMRLADAFYQAGAGDTAALPALLALLIDRSRGMLVRASAAEYISRFVAEGGGFAAPPRTQTSLEGPPARSRAQPAQAGPPLAPELRTRIVSALIGAAADPEPTVRAHAVRALGTLNEPRALTPLVARLSDEARVVRTAAAEALLQMQVTTLPGPAGAVLRAAQDDYAASLQTFPEVVSRQAARGWLESQRGRQDEADRALAVALALDPSYVPAHVFKGIVAARTGRFEDAVGSFERARRLAPGYPNLDRMIEEARRHRAGTPR